MKNKRAFSLVELLIGLVIMGIITAGAVSALGTGQTLALRQVSSSVRLNTERFTIESIYYEIRKGGNLAEVEVLNAPVPYLDDDTSRDKYIFLADDDRAMLREFGKPDAPLIGADGIKTLKFELPDKLLRSEAKDFTLSVDVVANRVNYTDDSARERTARRRIGLLGAPLKSGDSGDAVRFRFREVVALSGVELLTPNPLIVDNADTNKVFANAETVDKGTVLQASFDVVGNIPLEDKANMIYDEDSLTWWISDGVAEFQLVDGNGKVFDTGNKYTSFDVVGGGQIEGGFVYFKVEVTLPDGYEFTGGFTVKDGNKYEIMSPFVWIDMDKDTPLDKPGTPMGEGLFYELFEYAKNLSNKWNTDGNNAINDVKHHKDFKFDVSTTTGAFVFRRAAGNVGDDELLAAYKMYERHHFNVAAGYERFARAKGIPSAYSKTSAYTNVTNHSVVFDLLFNDVTARSFGVVINCSVVGMADRDKRARPTGFTVSLENAVSTKDYPVTRRGFSMQAAKPDLAGDKGDVIDHVAYGATRTGDQFSAVSPVIYSLRHLQNSVFSFNDDLDYGRRMRVMYTILEYKDSESNSKFIVRAKILKPMTAFTDAERDKISEEEGDRFFMGKNFELSEPAWFGNFVGTYPVSGTDAATSESFSAEFQGTPLKLKDIDGVERAENRERFYGVAFTGSAKDDRVTIYYYSIAPGFTPEELLAIMPAGAQLMSPGGTTDLNTELFGDAVSSDGAGNEGRLSALKAKGIIDGELRLRVGVTAIKYPDYKPYYLKDPIPGF